MGKAHRTAISPKLYKEKFTTLIEDVNWSEARLVEWIKTTCQGEVWFDHYRVNDSYRNFRHHVVHTWFQKRPDAMLYKLEFVLP